MTVVSVTRFQYEVQCSTRSCDVEGPVASVVIFKRAPRGRTVDDLSTDNGYPQSIICATEKQGWVDVVPCSQWLSKISLSFCSARWIEPRRIRCSINPADIPKYSFFVIACYRIIYSYTH